jgi:hypothetical protein
MQLTLTGIGPYPPVKRVVTAFRGTEDEMNIELTVAGRQRRILQMRVLPGKDSEPTGVSLT